MSCQHILTEDMTAMNTSHFSYGNQRHSIQTVSKLPEMGILTKISKKDIILKVYGRTSASPIRFKHHLPPQRVKLLHIDKPLLNYRKINDTSNSRLNSSTNQRYFQFSRRQTLKLHEKILLPIAKQLLISK